MLEEADIGTGTNGQKYAVRTISEVAAEYRRRTHEPLTRMQAWMILKQAEAKVREQLAAMNVRS